MTGVCKLLFDLCFYYTLSGYYLNIITGEHPSSWGVPALILCAAADAAIRSRKRSARNSGENATVGVDPITVICCALPGLPAAIACTTPALIFTTWQMIQFVPAWAFFGFTIWSGRVHTSRGDFQEHFRFTGKLFALSAFGLFAFQKLGSAITGAVPYLIVYLLAGVCLMRILRDDGKLSAGRNIAVSLLLLAGSIVLAAAQAPKLILGAAGFIYQNIVVRIVIGLAIVAGALLYVIIKAVSWIFSFLKTGSHDVEIDAGGSAQEIFGDGVETLLNEPPAWLEIAATVLLVIAVALVIFLIMRKLLGNKREGSIKKPYTEQQESVRKHGQTKNGGLFRPNEPRRAVRWYYRKYLREGISRGAEPVASDTSLSIRRKYSSFFPGDEAGELRELYIAARYRQNKEIRKEDADAAAEIWRRLNEKRRRIAVDDG